MDIFGAALARLIDATRILFKALSFGAKVGKKGMERVSQKGETEFWVNHRGIEWHIKAKFSPDGRVDVYIGPRPNDYPHFHVFYPDRHKESNEWVQLSLARKGGKAKHLSLEELPPALQQYLLSLLADMRPEDK